jgi:hypothetical protein
MTVKHKLAVTTALLALSAPVSTASAVAQSPGNPYPTVVVADYILGCTAVNGTTRQALEKCACSIDVIAAVLPYEKYESAEAFMSLGHITGERGVLFRTSEAARGAIGELKRAQIEAEVRCF